MAPLAGPPATAASEGVVTLAIFIPILGRSWKQQRKPSSVAVSGRVPDQLLLSSCSISGSAIQSHSSIILPDLSEQFVMCVDHVVDDQSSGRASGLAVAG